MMAKPPSKKSVKSPPPILEGKGVVPNLHLASWLGGDIRYISSQAFHLVLYVATEVGHSHPSPPLTPPPRFKRPSDWKLLFHQTAGYACHHRYIYAKFLEPRTSIKKLGLELLSKYNDSLVAQPLSLPAANEYESLLGKYGLTAAHSYINLEEGFYPIDVECLSKVTKEKFAKDLRTELIKPMPKYRKRSISDLFANWVNFELAILGPNCD